MVFFDFSEAFDMVPHTLLLSKLKTLRFSGLVLRWLASYLSNRTQAVVGSNGEILKLGHIGTGVPQGSVLGPLLFLLFTNDLKSVIRHSAHMSFVDDLQIHVQCSPENLNDAIVFINEDVQAIFEGTEANILVLNLDKTHAMIVANSWYLKNLKLNAYPQIKVNNIVIHFVDSVKNLGIIVRPTLSWDRQVGSICRKVYGTTTIQQVFKYQSA